MMRLPWGLHHTEFWSIYTYCKYTSQSTSKFKCCWSDSSGKSEEFSNEDSSVGLFINVLKDAGIQLNYKESLINKNWNCIENPNPDYLDSAVLHIVTNNDSKYNLFVSPAGSGKTTSIVKYCVGNEKPIIIASPFIAVGVNYKENFINFFNSEVKKLSLEDRFLNKWHNKNLNERFVFSENENGERVFKQYNTATKKFNNIKNLPTNYIMICTVQFLTEIREKVDLYSNATLIIDEAHCIELDTKYCAENDKLFFEYFNKVLFVTATPNARIIRQIVNYLPEIEKYKVNGISPKIKINLVQPSERLVFDDTVGNIILDTLLSNRQTSAYCVYNSKKALDVIQELCEKENVKVCKIHADSPLIDIKQLENKSVIGTISMSSSINLFNRNVCIINGVKEMYNIIQSINRNRSKEVINVFINSLMNMDNYWFNYNIDVVWKREYKDQKELKAYIIDTITKKEYSEIGDKRTSTILKENKYYRFYKECRAVYYFRKYNNLEGYIKEVRVGNRIRFVEKDNLFGKREILLYDEDGKIINETFNLPYLFVNEFNKFNPQTKTHYVKQGDNLKDICTYINRLIDYVKDKDLLQIWEDTDTYMSFTIGKRKGKKWNKPYTRKQLEVWKMQQKSSGKLSKIKHSGRYEDEILKIVV